MMRNGFDKARTNYLFNLIERGENKKVEEFFHQHPDTINKIVSEHDWTPIMYACRYGNFELLRILENLGFTLEKHNTSSSTLMHLTFYSDKLSLIRHLVLNLDLNNKDYTQMMKYSIFIKKKEITFFLFLNGGYVVNNHPLTQGPQMSYFMIPEGTTPALVPPGTAPSTPLYKYMSSEKKDEEVQSDQILMLAESRDHVRDIMLPLVQFRSKVMLHFLIGLCCEKERFGTSSKHSSSNKNIVDVDLQSNQLEPTPTYLDPVLHLLHENKEALEAVLAFL